MRRRNLLRSLAAVGLIVGVTLVIVGLSPSTHRGAPASLIPFDTFTPSPAETTPTDAAPSESPPTPVASGPSVAQPQDDGGVSRMTISSLGIDYPIEDIGLLPGNVLDTPHDALGTIGWYYIYTKPGLGGNAVFSAHINYNFKQGPFANLSKVQAGDQIVVQMDNGTTYTYRVFRKQRYDVGNIPMAELIWPTDRPANAEWITLITCGGNFVATQANGLGEYTQRDVVVAERVS